MDRTLSTTTRRAAGLLLGALLSLGATAALAEPSAQEMRAALQARFAGINENMRNTAERCNQGGYRNDPVLAMMCLQTAITGGTTNGGREIKSSSVSLSRFEKIACEKAQGKPGFICDYVAGMGTDMQNLPPSMRAMMGNGQVAQARFVKQGSGWIVLSAD